MRIYNKQPTASDQSRKKTSVNVLISGFARQSQLSVEDISAIVDSLPAFHLVSLDMITYDPDWATNTAQRLLDAPCPKRSKAVYVREERRILVFNFDNASELKHALYHEIGHHVFERIVDSTIRKRWVTDVNPNSNHVTNYAAENSDEDFAESYAIFVQNPERLREIPKKYVFMRDEIFSGVARNIKRGHLDVLA